MYSQNSSRPSDLELFTHCSMSQFKILAKQHVVEFWKRRSKYRTLKYQVERVLSSDQSQSGCTESLANSTKRHTQAAFVMIYYIDLTKSNCWCVSYGPIFSNFKIFVEWQSSYKQLHRYVCMCVCICILYVPIYSDKKLSSSYKAIETIRCFLFPLELCIHP